MAAAPASVWPRIQARQFAGSRPRWVAKTSLQSPSPGEIDEHDVPPCPDFF